MARTNLESFRLKERCSIKSSKRIFAREYVDFGIPFWRSKDVIDKSLGVFDNFDLYISKERFGEIADKFGSPRKNDLLISSVGNRAGQPYVVQDEGDFYFKDGNILWVSEFENLDPEFLAYWLKSSNGQLTLSSIMIGSAQKALTIDALRNLEVSMPSYSAQLNAVKSLKLLDCKIALDRQINKTLEQMAQALFKSWFVDFDPVVDNALDAGFFEQGLALPDELLRRAEARKAARESADFIPLPENIRHLFPSAFEECSEPSLSLGGWVPEGWVYDCFSALLSSTIGGDWGKDSQDEKHTTQSRIVRGTDIPDLISGQLSNAPLRWVDPKKLQSRQIEAGDIIIEVSGGSPTQSTGRSIFMTQSMLNRLGGIVEPASFCRRFKPKSFCLGILASLHLQAIYSVGKMWEYQNQSTGIANFQTKFFLEAERVLMPSDKVLENFCQIVIPLIEKSQNSEQVALAKLRDTLLPKLISGELHLDEIEAGLTKEGIA